MRNSISHVLTPDTLSTPAKLNLGNLTAAHTGSRLIQSTAVEATHEHCRALLVKSTMDNVVVLSALEAHLGSMIPASKDRLKVLVDAYTISAAMRIAGR